MEEEFRQEDVRVSMVTPVVKHALDHRSKHELVVLRSVSFDYKERVIMSHWFVTLYHIILYYGNQILRKLHFLCESVFVLVLVVEFRVLLS